MYVCTYIYSISSLMLLTANLNLDPGIPSRFLIDVGGKDLSTWANHYQLP